MVEYEVGLVVVSADLDQLREVYAVDLVAWVEPRRGSHTISEQLADTPDVIGQARSHGWCAGKALQFRFAQFMMGKAKIVRRANQVHACFHSA